MKKNLGDDIIIGIIGNKEDLQMKNDDENIKDAKEYAEKIYSQFKMTSTKIQCKGFEKYAEELLIDYINKNEILKKRKIDFR